MPLVQKTFGDLITFTRSSSGGRFNALGNFEMAASNQPRFDYDPITKVLRGILIEEARTNLLTRSSEFSDAVWIALGSSLTPGFPSPDGGAAAFKITEDTSTGRHMLGRTNNLPVTAGALTNSWFIKPNGRRYFQVIVFPDATNSFSAIFDTQTLTITDSSARNTTTTQTYTGASISNAGGGYYRLSLSGTTTAVVAYAAVLGAVFPTFAQHAGGLFAGGVQYTGDGASGAYAWHAQLESGAFSTSPIPTTTAQVTRAADVASVNVLSPWFDTATGTLLYSGSRIGGSPVLVQLDDGTANNVIRLSVIGGNIVADVISVGVSQASLNLGAAPAIGEIFKCALAFANNDFAGCLNGGTVQTDVLGTVPSGLTTRRIGGSTTGVTGAQHVRLDKHYPRRLSNAELQGVTT